MSRDVRELLEGAAPEPSRPLDAEGLVDRAVRQRRSALAAAAVLVLVVAAGVVGIALGLVPDEDALLIYPAGPEPMPATSSPYLGGTADPDLPAGEIGEVSVVAVAVYDQTADAYFQGDDGDADWESRPAVAMVLRNMTDEPVTAVQVRGEVRGPDGEQLAGIASGGFHHPEWIQPGEIAIVGGIFTNVTEEDLEALPDQLDFDLDVWSYETERPDRDEQREQAEAGDLIAVPFSLVVADTDRVDDEVRVHLRNDEDLDVTMPVITYLVCFDGDELIGGAETFRGTLDEPIPAGGEAVVTVHLTPSGCPEHVVGAIGQHAPQTDRRIEP